MKAESSRLKAEKSFPHLYIHVPFCTRRCTYCDFSIAVRREIPVDEYFGALEREISQWARPVEQPRTVYLGGGTPSKLGGEGITTLAAMLGPGAGSDEFTIEANPEDVTVQAVSAWRRAGINRVSIGAQSFNESVLEWMHRTHTAGAIAQAVRNARLGGIDNISIDLIFSLPESSGRDWRDDLEKAIALEPEHISLYGLTVEEHTPLSRQILRGQVAAAPDARYAEEYLLAHELLGSAGFRFYEVSNAARPGRAAIHNSAYWRHVPYLGLGPSAHSFDGHTRWWNEPAYAKWLELVSEGSSPIMGRETLTASELEMERLYLGLRRVEGMELDADLAQRVLPKAEEWAKAGWATLRPSAPPPPPSPQSPQSPQSPPSLPSLSLTPLGWLRLDVLVASI